jgi:hypothetical protein
MIIRKKNLTIIVSLHKTFTTAIVLLMTYMSPVVNIKNHRFILKIPFVGTTKCNSLNYV